ncbi:MAG: Fe2+-dependent dioxygenase [Sphingomonadaceae bacterium]
MFLALEEILAPDAAAAMADTLLAADWTDGRVTAGYQSAAVKHNRQLPETSATALQLGRMVLDALSGSLLFQSAALPAAIFPPLFNRYDEGDHFGTHVDNAFRLAPDGRRIRTDLSATLFLSPLESYEGGELVIEEGDGTRAFRLPAGHLLLYPATTLHRVAPVTRGTRLAAFFWVQSLVADAQQRAILFDMDLAMQSLRTRLGDNDPALVALTGCYHNLLRAWGRN